MRRLLLAAAGAMALAGGATVANAASTVTGPVPAVLTPPSSAIFGSNITGGPTAFNDTFTFTIAGAPGLTDSQVTTFLLNGTQNVNFSSLALDGMTTTVTRNGSGMITGYSGGVFSLTSTDPNPETWAILNPVLLGVGTHTLNFVGNLIGPNGSYSGTINVQAAVPEAGTWAMMLLGFGAMGLVIRRRRKPVLAQLA